MLQLCSVPCNHLSVYQLGVLASSPIDSTCLVESFYLYTVSVHFTGARLGPGEVGGYRVDSQMLWVCFY